MVKCMDDILSRLPLRESTFFILKAQAHKNILDYSFLCASQRALFNSHNFKWPKHLLNCDPAILNEDIPNRPIPACVT